MWLYYSLAGVRHKMSTVQRTEAQGDQEWGFVTVM